MNPLSIAAVVLPFVPVVGPQDPPGSELTKRLVERAEAAVDEYGLDGLVVVVGIGDDVLLQRGWGRLPGGALATPASSVRAAPLVEPLAVLVALQLVDEGKIELDAPVGAYLEGFEIEDTEVTVHHLLSQTSGLIGWSDSYRAEGSGDADVQRLVGIVRAQGVQTTPGTCFEYSESNGLLVGALVEEVTGSSLADAITTRVLEPADLDRTGFGVEGVPPAQEEARCSTEIGGELVSVAHDVHPFGEDRFSASALDLFELRRAIEDGRIDGDDALDSMGESKRLDDGSDTGYGYGLSVGDLENLVVWTAGGSAEGTTVHFAHYPEPDLTVVLLVARETASLNALERDLARLVLGMALPGVQDLEVVPAQVAAYTGRYQVGCTMLDVAVEEDGHLSVSVADRPTYHLLFQGARRFVAERDPEIVFEFVVDEGVEKAERMIIDERGRISEAVRFD